MDFAQPVSFKNADIGRCAHQKPREDEGREIPAEIVTQPEPVPTPAFPTPTPVVAQVSVFMLLLSNFNLYSSSFQREDNSGYLICSTSRIRGRETGL